jgi:hypothetical protein
VPLALKCTPSNSVSYTLRGSVIGLGAGQPLGYDQRSFILPYPLLLAELEAIIHFSRFELRSITCGNEMSPSRTPSLISLHPCPSCLSTLCARPIFLIALFCPVCYTVRVDSCTRISLYRENFCASVRVLIGVLGLFTIFPPSMPTSTSFSGSTLCKVLS